MCTIAEHCYAWRNVIKGFLYGLACFGFELARRVSRCSIGKKFFNASITKSHNASAKNPSILSLAYKEIVYTFLFLHVCCLFYVFQMTKAHQCGEVNFLLLAFWNISSLVGTGVCTKFYRCQKWNPRSATWCSCECFRPLWIIHLWEGPPSSQRQGSSPAFFKHCNFLRRRHEVGMYLFNVWRCLFHNSSISSGKLSQIHPSDVQLVFWNIWTQMTTLLTFWPICHLPVSDLGVDVCSGWRIASIRCNFLKEFCFRPCSMNHR